MTLGETTRVRSISVMFSGIDINGKRCDQPVMAYDLTQHGARLDGLSQSLVPGTGVTVQYHDEIAAAQIVWVAVSGSDGTCQVGIRLRDPKRCPWKGILSDSDNMLRLPDRRKAARYKVAVGVQLSDEDAKVPMRTNTVDVGISGCYIDTLFPPPVGARLKVLLWLGQTKLVAKGIVRASYPGVGMGIEFLDLSWEETERLYRFLESQQEQTTSQ